MISPVRCTQIEWDLVCLSSVQMWITPRILIDLDFCWTQTNPHQYPTLLWSIINITSVNFLASNSLWRMSIFCLVAILLCRLPDVILIWKTFSSFAWKMLSIFTQASLRMPSWASHKKYHTLTEFKYHVNSRAIWFSSEVNKDDKHSRTIMFIAVVYTGTNITCTTWFNTDCHTGQ